MTGKAEAEVRAEDHQGVEVAAGILDVLDGGTLPG
jgi:hypothetical protein